MAEEEDWDTQPNQLQRVFATNIPKVVELVLSDSRANLVLQKLLLAVQEFQKLSTSPHTEEINSLIDEIVKAYKADPTLPTEKGVKTQKFADGKIELRDPVDSLVIDDEKALMEEIRAARGPRMLEKVTLQPKRVISTELLKKYPEFVETLTHAHFVSSQHLNIKPDFPQLKVEGEELKGMKAPVYKVLLTSTSS